MTAGFIFFLISAILMGVSAFVADKPVISIYKLAWCAFILGIMFTFTHVLAK